jgi:hypothetical protein
MTILSSVKSREVAVLEMFWFMLRYVTKRLGGPHGWSVDFGSAFCR